MNDIDLDRRAISNFRTYLQFPTVHPDPDYSACVEWLRSQATELGLTFTVIHFVTNNPIVVMGWEGKEPSLPSILLNSHMDVVPVDKSRWTHPPFAADIDDDGKIFARGSQDMKCVGMQQLEAVRRLKARGTTQLRRTVYLSFVPDEELGGKRGMEPFVEGRPSLKQDPPTKLTFSELNVGFCLDEGLVSATNDYEAFYDERRYCWFIAHFHGVAGHGLSLLEGTAGEKLTCFLQRVANLRSAEKDRLDRSNGNLTLGDVTSVNLTMLAGGSQPNVLPSTLSAWFDVRLPPSVSLSAWKDQLNQWAEEAGGGIEFEYVTTAPDTWEAAPIPDEKTCPFWSTLTKVCQRFGADVSKRIFPGATDSRFVRQFHRTANAAPGCRRIQAIGFTPIRRTPVLLHDHDEYVTEEEFLNGCRLYTELLYDLSELP
ncbi:unnamed protein product [Dicrocoelium dendriticum]|nr:unnamed protein product [Dicrocoelium dendriticum]